MLDIAEPERTIIRLTSCEREEFARAEVEIGETLNAFLRCGAALSVIRNKRLYRESFVSFADYVRERWGMSESAAGALLTNYHIAQGLQGVGIKLPPEVTQSSMKALGGFTARGRVAGGCVAICAWFSSECLLSAVEFAAENLFDGSRGPHEEG